MQAMFFACCMQLWVERSCCTTFAHVVSSSHKSLFLDAQMSTRSATDSMASDPMLAQEYCFWRDNYEVVIVKNRRRKSSQRTELVQLNRVTSWGAYQASVIIHMAQTPQNGSLHIFRKGITPEYDDPLNRNGGLFKLTFQATSCAADAFTALCGSLVLGHLPTHVAVNGVTFAKKGTSCGLKVWVGSRAKQVVADVQEWFTKELDGFILSCVFCPIASLLTSIQKKHAALCAPPQPIQQPQGPNPRDAIGILKVPPPLPVMMPAVNNAGNMGITPWDLPNEASFSSDGSEPDTAASGRSLGYSSQSSTSNANDRARGSRLSSLSHDECILEQAVEECVQDVRQTEASSPQVPATLSIVHNVLEDDAMRRLMMSRSRYSEDWVAEAADAVRKRLQATAERCRACPHGFMEVWVDGCMHMHNSTKKEKSFSSKGGFQDMPTV